MSTAPWGLLQQRTSTDGASPLITMYDDASGERVELSAVSFANWVAKTANLLVDEFDIEPGDPYAIDLPAHWQSLVLGFAVCAVGAVADDDGLIRAMVEGPEVPTGPPGDDILVFSLRPMGAGCAQPGGLDYAATVRLHGDFFPGGAGSDVPDPQSSFPAGARVLTAETAHAAAFETMLAALSAGGSLVLVRNEDPTTRERRVAAERVTLIV